MLELIDNRLDDKTLASQLNYLLAPATAAYIHVAYLRESGVALLRDAITEFLFYTAPEATLINPEHLAPGDLEPIMVRRSKADIREADGSPLFPPRWVETTAVTFMEGELQSR